MNTTLELFCLHAYVEICPRNKHADCFSWSEPRLYPSNEASILDSIPISKASARLLADCLLQACRQKSFFFGRMWNYCSKRAILKRLQLIKFISYLDMVLDAATIADLFGVLCNTSVYYSVTRQNLREVVIIICLVVVKCGLGKTCSFAFFIL